jgi:hypothetical protein
MKSTPSFQSTTQPTILSRYTTLPVLLDIIQRKCLTLLSPEAWPDQNDQEVMLDYKSRRYLTCLLAICFSSGDETVHHWNAFASGPAGCRIDFHFSALLDAIAQQSGCRHGKVSYRKITKLSVRDLSAKRRPFVKRWPYRIEQEYRIIFESRDAADSDRVELTVPIMMSCIQSITVSQSMPKSVFDSIKKQLGPKLNKRISRSTLFQNKVWINKFNKQ